MWKMPWSIIDLRLCFWLRSTFCCLQRLCSEANPREVKPVINWRFFLQTHKQTGESLLTDLWLNFTVIHAHVSWAVETCWLIKVKQIHHRGRHVSALLIVNIHDPCMCEKLFCNRVMISALYIDFLLNAMVLFVSATASVQGDWWLTSWFILV